MEKKFLDFIQQNSPGGGFLQSEYWRKFQESYGRKTFQLEEKDEDGNFLAYASVITHTLPIAGDYFYVPRGPIINKIENSKKQKYISNIKKFLFDLVKLAKDGGVNWIRVEPNSEEELNLIRENLPSEVKIKKSPVDMQPREILIMDISGSEEEILARMKQKTRYNIRLAEKRNVHIACNLPAGRHGTKHLSELLRKTKQAGATQKNLDDFLKLIKITAKRDRITTHPEGYYRKMFETIPGDILKLYVAEYQGKIIAANIVSFFGNTATYMHGASDNIHREVMAPYLLQWQAILDAKKVGCEKYDLGGVKSHNMEHGTWSSKSWEGITRFKLGFVPDVEPIKFPGCYDIILKPGRFKLYRFLQKIKRGF